MGVPNLLEAKPLNENIILLINKIWTLFPREFDEILRANDLIYIDEIPYYQGIYKGKITDIIQVDDKDEEEDGVGSESTGHDLIHLGSIP